MRRRNRFKPRVVWLPVYGDSSYAESGGIDNAAGVRYHLNLEANTGIVYNVSKVTWDGSESSAQQQGFGTGANTLHDFVQGTSWRLRRIVGKCWVNCNGASSQNTSAVRVSAGFIVCRTSSDGTIITDFDTTNPLAQDSADDPWIWKRDWLLSPFNRTASWPSGIQWNYLPNSNVGQASVHEGPHIDQKTARIIGPDECLAFMVAAQVAQTSDDLAPNNNELNVECIMTYRLLGSMRNNVGNRRNASR